MTFTGGYHEETEKTLYREPRLHLTSNNSVKNTIITAASCLVELKSFDFTTLVVGPAEEIQGAFGEFAGFGEFDAKKQAGRTRLFFCDQVDLK